MRACGFAPAAFLRFHERHQISHGFFHHSRGFHYLRQKHFAGAEQIADDTHPGHERAFDDLERFGKFLARFFGIRVDEIDDRRDERVREPFLDGACARLLPCTGSFTFA